MSGIGMIAAASRFTTDDERWRAVAQRDRRADGRFVYSVKTTGVYCRPSCGAKLAKRANVRFHASAADAERAGFRACKRCRPNEGSVVAERGALIARICRLIEQSGERLDLSRFAQAAGISPSRLARVFKAAVGMTPRQFADESRARRVRGKLTHSKTVTSALHAAGYGSSGRFYDGSDRVLGMKPAAFRKGGAGETIRFAVGRCSLGAVLVAATDQGVCWIALGDDPGALARELKDQFSRAELVEGGAAFVAQVAGVVAYLDEPVTEWNLPLDVRGTAFQMRVWRALSEVPLGATTTYAELARRIGKPKSIRAVGRACASNRIAVAIPCHRAVRSDGTLAGYRWGIERKATLLEREAADRVRRGQ